MGISETILAAMIGAIATVTTALFQIFTAFRNRNKADARPTKRGSAMRSVLAVLALMVASAAGGFLYSEFLKQRNGEDLRAMRDELRDLKKEMTAQFTGRNQPDSIEAAAPAVSIATDAAVHQVALEGVAANVESVVYIPACRPAGTALACDERDAQRIALCGTIPSYARVEDIELFVQPDAVQHAWDAHRVAFEQDLGGARFTGKSFEYAQGEDLKAVCVNFMHWSSEHPHIARILVQYAVGDTAIEAPPAEAPATMPGAVIAIDSLSPISQAAAAEVANH